MFARKGILQMPRLVTEAAGANAAERLRDRRVDVPSLRALHYPRESAAVAQALDAAVAGRPTSISEGIARATVAELLLNLSSGVPGAGPRIFLLRSPSDDHRHFGFVGRVVEADSEQTIVAAARLCAHDRSRWESDMEVAIDWCAEPQTDSQLAWLTEQLEALYCETVPAFRSGGPFKWPQRPAIVWLGMSDQYITGTHGWRERLEAKMAVRGFRLGALVQAPASQWALTASSVRAGHPAAVLLWREGARSLDLEHRIAPLCEGAEFIPFAAPDFESACREAEERLDVLEALHEPAVAEPAVATGFAEAARDLEAAASPLGVHRVLVLGGTPNTRQQLEATPLPSIEFRFVDGIARASRNSARPAVEWADIIVLWSSTPLDHAVSDLYKDLARGNTKVVNVRRRGASSLLQDLAALLLQASE